MCLDRIVYLTEYYIILDILLKEKYLRGEEKFVSHIVFTDFFFKNVATAFEELKLKLLLL